MCAFNQERPLKEEKDLKITQVHRSNERSLNALSFFSND